MNNRNSIYVCNSSILKKIHLLTHFGTFLNSFEDRNRDMFFETHERRLLRSRRQLIYDIMRIIFLHTFLIDGFFALQIPTIDMFSLVRYLLPSRFIIFDNQTKRSQCHKICKNTNFLDYTATLPENWPHFLITYDQRPTFWILTKGQQRFVRNCHIYVCQSLFVVFSGPN